MEKNNGFVKVISIFVASLASFTIIVSSLLSYGEKNAERYQERVITCLESGGSWIALGGSSGSGICLRNQSEVPLDSGLGDVVE